MVHCLDESRLETFRQFRHIIKSYRTPKKQYTQFSCIFPSISLRYDKYYPITRDPGREQFILF